MRTIEVQFEYGGTLYSATADFLLSAQPMIRVSDFYPGLPDYRREVYFVYNPAKRKMDFPVFAKKQKGFAEILFASICEWSQHPDVMLETGFGTNKVLSHAHTTPLSLAPAM